LFSKGILLKKWGKLIPDCQNGCGFLKRLLSYFIIICLLSFPVSAQDEKLVALTFDDGPSGRYTTRLLDGLRERNVKATFLLCGYRMEQYRELTELIFQEGHEIGLHGYSHKSLEKSCKNCVDEEIEKAIALVPKGCPVTFFRAPGGVCSASVKAAAAQRGLCLLNWSVDPRDWAVRNAQAVASMVIENVKDGDVILLHDMSDSSVDASLAIIDKLQADGYRFVTASELAMEKNIQLVPGTLYRRFG